MISEGTWKTIFLSATLSNINPILTAVRSKQGLPVYMTASTGLWAKVTALMHRYTTLPPVSCKQPVFANNRQSLDVCTVILTTQIVSKMYTSSRHRTHTHTTEEDNENNINKLLYVLYITETLLQFIYNISITLTSCLLWSKNNILMCVTVFFLPL
jgi:hypothetical protein